MATVAHKQCSDSVGVGSFSNFVCTFCRFEPFRTKQTKSPERFFLLFFAFLRVFDVNVNKRRDAFVSACCFRRYQCTDYGREHDSVTKCTSLNLCMCGWYSSLVFVATKSKPSVFFCWEIDSLSLCLSLYLANSIYLESVFFSSSALSLPCTWRKHSLHQQRNEKIKKTEKLIFNLEYLTKQKHECIYLSRMQSIQNSDTDISTSGINS